MLPRRVLSIVAGMIMLITVAFWAGSAQAQPGPCTTFPETQHTACGRFLAYWQQHGGLAQQGFPISNEFTEVSDLDYNRYTVQYFERAVFEYHPEQRPEFQVLLSQLGTFLYKQKYGPAGAPGQHASTTNPRFFPETRHTLGGRFRTYWEQHGGLAQQGFPISDEFTEVSDLDHNPYTVQYFERAVFEYHPEKPPEFQVLLSQLGTFRFRSIAGRATIYDTDVRGGVICRGAPVNRCSSTEGGFPVERASPNNMGRPGDTIATNPGGTVAARTVFGQFRLVTNSAVRLVAGPRGAGGQLFGQGLFNHPPNAGGEFTLQGVVNGKPTYNIVPIDTFFSVRVDPDGGIKVGVITGTQGVNILDPSGTLLRNVKEGEQVHGTPNGAIGPTEPVDDDTRRLWDIYGNGGDLAVRNDVFDPTKCNPAFVNELFTDVPADVAARLGCVLDRAQYFGPFSGSSEQRVMFFERGMLINMAPQYAFYGADPEILFQWDSYSPAGNNLDSLLAAHPEISTRLGSQLRTCTSAQWAYQHFAGGTVFVPPEVVYDQSGPTCTDSLNNVPRVLFPDGSIYMKPQPGLLSLRLTP